MDGRPLIPGMAEEAAMLEGALPAPSALVIGLAANGTHPELAEQARTAAEQARPKAQTEPFWYAGHAAALLSSVSIPRPGPGASVMATGPEGVAEAKVRSEDY
jgi:hypothetical protein